MSSEEMSWKQYSESQERCFHFSVERAMQYYRVYYRLGISLITITSIKINVMTCELLLCSASHCKHPLLH